MPRRNYKGLVAIPVEKALDDHDSKIESLLTVVAALQEKLSAQEGRVGFVEQQSARTTALVQPFIRSDNTVAADSQLQTVSTQAGTVTSFSATPASIFDVANPTTAPALSLDNQTQNKVLASPDGSTGQPAFRALVDSDVPNALTVNGGTVDNTPIGSTTRSTVKGTDVDANSAFKFNGTQVVIGRKTGWGSPSGTLSRAAYTAYAGQTVSNPPTQAEMQALDDAVKLLSQTVAALLTDAHSATSGHGLIGP